MSSTKTKILITGATGFTGSFVVREFLNFSDIYTLHLFVRSKEKIAQLGFDTLPVTIHYGSFEEQDTFQKACEGKDIVINIASLGFGHAESIITSLLKARIKRALFISTTSIYTNLNSSSKNTRMEAESLIMKSGLDYTIIRPTMIFGTAKDRNICRLIKFIKKWPIIPVAGPGTFLLQPVYVCDLSNAIIAITNNKNTIKKSYTISGKDAISYNELISTIAKCINKKIYILHIPLRIVTFCFTIYEKLVKNPKIKVEQLLRLNENKTFSYENAEQDFGYNPTSIEIALTQEIQEILGDSNK